METYDSFSGAKIALICDSNIVTYLRDKKTSIPFPNLWDLAGGGREKYETPFQCVLRETEEEFGLQLDAARIEWKRRYPSATEPDQHAYFMVAQISEAEISAIQFGNEGQYWQMMDIREFLDHPYAVPQLQSRLADYLSETTKI